MLNDYMPGSSLGVIDSNSGLRAAYPGTNPASTYELSDLEQIACLSFLICKMGTIIVPTLWGCREDPLS